jgi:hypothetical protein
LNEKLEDVFENKDLGHVIMDWKATKGITGWQFYTYESMLQQVSNLQFQCSQSYSQLNDKTNCLDSLKRTENEQICIF